jgi:uncharacterized protein YyaL (SSP411 family)
MASKDVAPVLAKEFVTLKLDYDRMPGAKEIEKRYIAEEQGLPWFAFVSPDGKAVATSTGPKGNSGFPSAPAELAHFKTMLQAAKRHLTDADIDGLMASLEAANKK